MDKTAALDPKKPTFASVYASTALGYGLLDTIAELADVPRYVLNQMLVGEPVAPQDAQAVLRVINQQTGEQWSLANTNIPVLPVAPPVPAQKRTLAEIRNEFHFDIVQLARKAEVNEIVIVSMLRGREVYPAQALKVLAALSDLAKKSFTLKNVHVPLIKDE